MVFHRDSSLLTKGMLSSGGLDRRLVDGEA